MQQQQQQNIDTLRVEEIPAKEPVFNAVPKKSALKKKPGSGSGGAGGSSVGGGSSSGPGTPTQDTLNRPLIVRQDNAATLK